MKKYLLAIESAASESSVAIVEVHPQLNSEGLSVYKVAREWLAYNRSGSLDHAEQLLPLLDSLLAEAAITKAELAAVAFNQGPGAFTGLRIACGLAQGMALGLDLPLIPIDSLRATAQLALDYLLATKQIACTKQDTADNKKSVNVDYVVTLLDARMSEAYMAIYQLRPVADCEQGTFDLKQVQKPSLIAINEVLMWLDGQRMYDDRRLFFCGNALAVYAEELARSFEQKSFDFTVLPDQVTEWPSAGVIAQLAVNKWQRGEAIEAHLAAPIYLRDKVAFTEKERAAGLIGNPAAALPEATQSLAADEVDAKPSAAHRAFQLAHEHYQLRPMREEDIAAALLIEQTVQDYPWTRGNFKDSLRAAYPAWVIEQKKTSVEQADASQRIVGFAIQMLAPDVAHVLLIAVEPSLQGAGLGSLLLKTLEQNALAHGLDKQILEVRDSNLQAQRFYLRHRYAVIGKRKGYYREVSGSSEDAIVLEKQLSPEDAALDAFDLIASTEPLDKAAP